MLNYLINGSGFKAFYFALKLRSLNKKSSIAINFTNNLGGIYNSPKHKRYYLDLGCHLFDFTDKNLKSIFEIKNQDIIKVPLSYASNNNKYFTNNYSIYDYRKSSFINSVRDEIKIQYNNKKKFKNLREYYINKFGPLSTIPINNLSLKLTGHSIDKINYLSREVFFSDRLLIYNNNKSLKLKKNGYEELIAANTKYTHDYSDNYIVFTFKNGNYGFYKHAMKLLKKKNIELISNRIVKSKKIYETNAPKEIEDKYAIKVPMHLIYLEVESYPYTYLHDFSDNPIFRVSSPGFYTKQIFNKKSYLCIEIPDPFNIYDFKTIKNVVHEYFSKNKNSKIFKYFYLSKSYPSIYKNSYNYNKKNNYFNPLIYSKKNIMKEVDRIVT